MRFVKLSCGKRQHHTQSHGECTQMCSASLFWQQIWGFGGEPALSSFLLLQRPSHTQSASSARFSSRGSRPVTLTLSPWTRPGPLCCLVSYLLTQGSVLRCSDCTAHLHWATKRRRRKKKRQKPAWDRDKDLLIVLLTVSLISLKQGWWECELPSKHAFGGSDTRSVDWVMVGNFGERGETPND